MYDSSVISRRIASYERSHPGRRLRSTPPARAREIAAYLEGRLDAKGIPQRPRLTTEFRHFVENERAMSKASFLYFATRYCVVQSRIGMGGVVPFEPFESQLLLLRRLASDERHMWERYDLNDLSFDGLLYFIHKARQLGYTTLCQLLLLHRSLFYSDYKTLTASLDDQKTQDTHAKWWLAYSHLPYWLRTGIDSREKERGKWLSNGSYCALQDFAQESGLGQGNTWDGFHLTEVAAVEDAYCEQHLENHLWGAIPMSMRAMGFLESTAQGRDNWWHRKFMRAWEHAYDRWRAVFVPWYATPEIYSRPDIPAAWSPKPDTVAHAEKVRRTSSEYVGSTITLTPEQMYWWETKRDSYKQDGALSYFLTNWCATIDESFQYVDQGAFNSERIIALEDRVDRSPVAYELIYDAQSRALVSPRIVTPEREVAAGRPRVAPRSYSLGGLLELAPVYTEKRDEYDPRGLLMMFEPPRQDVIYSIGVDTAGGIVGWQRDFRRSDDDESRKDNSVASIWYHDRKSNSARQAAEFAGPVAPAAFAPLVLALGRIYRGLNTEEMGAPLIIEVSPSESGARVQQILISEYAYYNFFQWVVFNGIEMIDRNSWGWIASTSSVPLLWSRGKEFVESTPLLMRPQSQFLLRELSGCRWDPLRRRGFAPAGSAHDDRVTAALLALWQLYNWANPIAAAKPQTVRTYGPGDEDPRRVDFQRRDFADGRDYAGAVDEWMDRILAR